MPHMLMTTGSQSTAFLGASRPIIPGVTPGGQFAGREAKPALLLQDVEVFFTGTLSPAADTTGTIQVSLALSKEEDLDPSLYLHVGQLILGRGEDAGGDARSYNWHPTKYWQGTIWAPAYVGIATGLSGTNTYTAEVHVDYEVVMIPWMDWFIRWEFLDNVTHASAEY